MIDKISVFAADIDGTLAGKGEQLMPLTKAGLEKLHEQGIMVGLASGRPLDESTVEKGQFWGLNFDFDFAIGMNGGDLWAKETNEYTHYMQLDGQTIKEILEMIWDMDVNCIIYKNAYHHIKAKRMDNFLRESQQRNHSYIEIGSIDELSDGPTGKIEVHLTHDIEDELLRRIKANKSDKWTYCITFDSRTMHLENDFINHVTYEFMNPDLHKGVALKKYCEMKNIPLEETIAFGDQQNDFGLIQTAGWGVCLKNGCDECKQVAQAVTEYDVFNDGVGHYLEDHVFSKDSE